MYKQTIGIIGGFGAYATLDFYERFLNKFKSECERNYPHIYMDNNYTMPSRTRALLYGDDYDTVVEEICTSVENMKNMGVDYIIMVCGTAHAFLPEIYKKIPWAKDKIFDIINCLKRKLNNERVKDIVILVAEGTLKKNIYPNYLKDINCIVPEEKDYKKIRLFIESVKQNKISSQIAREWNQFIDKFNCSNVLLGCTEFPVLVNYINQVENGDGCKINYYDPLEAALDELKKNIK